MALHPPRTGTPSEPRESTHGGTRRPLGHAAYTRADAPDPNRRRAAARRGCARRRRRMRADGRPRSDLDARGDARARDPGAVGRRADVGAHDRAEGRVAADAACARNRPRAVARARRRGRVGTDPHGRQRARHTRRTRGAHECRAGRPRGARAHGHRRGGRRGAAPAVGRHGGGRGPAGSTRRRRRGRLRDARGHALRRRGST